MEKSPLSGLKEFLTAFITVSYTLPLMDGLKTNKTTNGLVLEKAPQNIYRYINQMMDEKTEEDPEDLVLFPEDVPDVGGTTFLFAWENKLAWVDFTLTWTKATGFFKQWRDYCIRKKHD